MISSWWVRPGSCPISTLPSSRWKSDFGGCAVGDGEQRITRLGQLGGGAVDEDRRGRHPGGIDLSVVRARRCSDGIQVESRMEPGPGHDRVLRRGQGADDVGGRDDVSGTRLDADGDVGADRCTEGRQGVDRAGPDPDLTDRSNRADRGDVLDGQSSRTDQTQRGRVGIGQRSRWPRRWPPPYGRG